MSKLKTAVIVLWLALAPLAYAQDGTALTQVRTASQTLISEESQGLDIDWTGQGTVAGDMLEATFKNTGSQSMTVKILPGIVLTDKVGQAQPIMLEDSLEFTLAPGDSTTTPLRGYCLDYSLDAPAMGASVDYDVTADTSKYESAIKNLWAGLRLDRDGKFVPVLKPLQHRTIVIQRAIWATLGGENPSTEAKLDSDLKADSIQAGHEFSEEKLHFLSERIWNDVEKTQAEAPRE